MATMHHPVENPSGDAPIEPPAEPDTIQERRARRMAALRKAAGMWADRKDIPSDGLQYQRAMRVEWR